MSWLICLLFTLANTQSLNQTGFNISEINSTSNSINTSLIIPILPSVNTNVSNNNSTALQENTTDPINQENPITSPDVTPISTPNSTDTELLPENDTSVADQNQDGNETQSVSEDSEEKNESEKETPLKNKDDIIRTSLKIFLLVGILGGIIVCSFICISLKICCFMCKDCCYKCCIRGKKVKELEKELEKKEDEEKNYEEVTKKSMIRLQIQAGLKLNDISISRSVFNVERQNVQSQVKKVEEDWNFYEKKKTLDKIVKEQENNQVNFYQQSKKETQGGEDNEAQSYKQKSMTANNQQLIPDDFFEIKLNNQSMFQNIQKEYKKKSNLLKDDDEPFDIFGIKQNDDQSL